MPTELCGEPHPDLTSVICDKALPCWGRHSNAKHHVNWPGRKLPTRKAASQLDVVEIALRSGRVHLRDQR